MSKIKDSKIGNLSTTLAVLLEKLQDRISVVAAHDRETREELTQVETTLSQLVEKANQNLRDNATGTTKALNALKDSTQVAFDAVREDMSKVQTALTKFNSRISALEGQSRTDVENIYNVRSSLSGVLARLSKLEATGQPTNSTSSLEVELRALLTRYGYRADSVGVKKTTYLPIHSIVKHGGLGALPISGGSEAIEIMISGSKPLTS